GGRGGRGRAQQWRADHGRGGAERQGRHEPGNVGRAYGRRNARARALGPSALRRSADLGACALPLSDSPRTPDVEPPGATPTGGIRWRTRIATTTSLASATI